MQFFFSFEILMHFESRFNSNNNQLETWFKKIGVLTVSSRVERPMEEVNELRDATIKKDRDKEFARIEQTIQQTGVKLQELHTECENTYTPKKEVTALQKTWSALWQPSQRN